MLEAKFIGHPGVRFCHESFDQQVMHRVKIDPGNAEVFHHGNFGADENRSLRLKSSGDPAKPVCALLGLSNPKTSELTFSKNLSRSKNGTTYCLVRGKLKNAVVKAAATFRNGEQSNIWHLRIVKAGKLENLNGKVIQDRARKIPETLFPVLFSGNSAG